MDLNAIDYKAVPATLDELLGLVRTHAQWVKQCLASPHTSWMPALAVLGREMLGCQGGVIMHALAVPFNSDDEKRGCMRQIGRRLYADQVIPAAAVMSSEAWVATDPIGKRDPRPPAERPDRREAVVIQGCATGGKPAVSMCMFITRDPSDVIVPGEWEEPNTEGTTTKLLNYIWLGYFDVVRQKYGLGPTRN